MQFFIPNKRNFEQGTINTGMYEIAFDLLFPFNGQNCTLLLTYCISIFIIQLVIEQIQRSFATKRPTSHKVLSKEIQVLYGTSVITLVSTVHNISQQNV